MKNDLKNLSKKELKDYINANGFFCTVDLIEKNEPNDEQKPENVPEGATFFKGIASTEEINRNGYIIRLNAWKSAISEFLKNPVVLLQHDSNQPIGKVLTAEVDERGLHITGYLFDDLTGGRFGRGLINALSTGHLTVDVEFQNSKTMEVLKEEEFKKLSWEEQNKEEWTLAVSKLEWVELSVVSIGANRKSLVTQRELVLNYLQGIEKNEPAEEAPVEEIAQVSEDQKIVEAVEDNQEEVVPEKEQEEAENEGETPEAVSDEAENAEEEAEAELVSVSVDEIKEAKNTILTLAEVVQKQKNEVEELRSKLANIAQPKGMANIHAIKSEEPKQEQSWLAPMLRERGIL
jgi:hypothetical protein